MKFFYRERFSHGPVLQITKLLLGLCMFSERPDLSDRVRVAGLKNSNGVTFDFYLLMNFLLMLLVAHCTVFRTEQLVCK